MFCQSEALSRDEGLWSADWIGEVPGFTGESSDSSLFFIASTKDQASVEEELLKGDGQRTVLYVALTQHVDQGGQEN